MSEDDGTLRDRDGNMYEKKFGGYYDKKWDVWSQDYSKDHSEIENQPVDHYSDGTPLFRPLKTVTRSSGSGSASGLELILGLILVVVILASGFIVLAILVSPIIAPMLLMNVECERRRGNLVEAKKWEPWGVISSLLAVMIVMGIACIIGLIFFSAVAGFGQNANTSFAIINLFIYILAFFMGFVAFFLMFITGISPTAIVYLRNREKKTTNIR